MSNEQVAMSNERKQSKLDELIQQYCPDGVEYKKLGDFATISRGGSFQKKDFLVFIMDKFIQDTVCLQRIHLPS